MVYVMARYYERQLVGALVRMADGEEPAAAFAASFGPNMVAELGKKYLDEIELLYKSDGARKLVSWRLPYKPPAVRGVEEESPLEDGEVHLLWATIVPPRSKRYSGAAGAGQLAWQRFAAIPVDPGAPLREPGSPSSAEYDLRAAMSARPDEERYRWALARLHFESGRSCTGRRSSSARSMRRCARSTRTRARSIRSCFWPGTSRRAVSSAMRGRGRSVPCKIDPTRMRGWEALAMIAQMQGDIDGAIEYGERTLHVAPEGVDNAAMTARLAKLRELRKRRDERVRAGAPG